MKHKLTRALTPNALRIWESQKKRGACFAEELERRLGLSSIEVQHALWELAAAGLAAADGFDQLRSMIDPDRRRAANSLPQGPECRRAGGRCSVADAPTPEDAIEQARCNDIAIESAARMLLNRYGVVFRDLLVQESNIPRWGILLRMFRRLEDRGLVRGGRFVSGFGGEQFALPEVLDSLRAIRNQEFKGEMTLAGADPVNLIGILVPGERTHAMPGRMFVIKSEMLEQPCSTVSREPKRPRYHEGLQRETRAPAMLFDA